jgi:two-component system response regulator HydG
VIRRAALLSATPVISRQSLPAEIAHPAPVAPSPAGPLPSEPAPGLKEASSSAEYAAILKVLKQVNYNKSKAAALLKIDRKTLYNKLRNKPGS